MLLIHVFLAATDDQSAGVPADALPHHVVGSVANRDGALTCPRTVHEQVFALYFEPDTRIRYEVLLLLLQCCSAAVKKWGIKG